MLKAPCHAAVVRSAAMVSAPTTPTTFSMAFGAAAPHIRATTTFRAALAHVPRPMGRMRFDRVRPVTNQGKGVAHTAAHRSAGLATMTTAAVVVGSAEVFHVDETKLDEAAGVYSQGHKERPDLPRAKLDIGGDERRMDRHLRLAVELLVVVFPFRRALSTLLFRRRLVGHILHEVVVGPLRVVPHRHQLHVCADGLGKILVDLFREEPACLPSSLARASSAQGLAS